MFRILVLLIYFPGVLFINLLFSEDVSSTMDTPEKVVGGKEFVVNVKIDKGSISSFSRFNQKLPAGLSAKPIETANAEFRFEGNEVKLIWLKLPKYPQISFSYSVSVDKRLKGDFNMGGSFAYIENNERKSINITSRNVSITPSPDIDPSLLVDIDEYQKTIVPDLSKKTPDVSCIRQQPVKRKNDMVVNVLIYKQNREKFAKIEERIPSGYIAENVDNKSGIFIFKNQTVKYLWMNLPPEDYFVVSYRLVPKPEKSLSQDISIDGSFSFIEETETKSIPIIQKDVNLNNISEPEIAAILSAPVATPSGGNQILAQENLTETKTTEKSQDTPTPGEDEEETVVTTETTPEKDKNTQVTTQIPDKTEEEASTTETADKGRDENQTSINTKYSNLQGDKTYILQPESGVYYRVQVAAGHRPVNIRRYFSRYNLKKEVKREKHEGWFKYSIGSFDIYKEARDYRVHVWNTTTIDDAFVSAYNDGKRITVQEALMISNQKWYR